MPFRVTDPDSDLALGGVGIIGQCGERQRIEVLTEQLGEPDRMDHRVVRMIRCLRHRVMDRFWVLLLH